MRGIREVLERESKERNHLRNLVDVFLNREELTQEELERVLRYRQICIQKVNDAGYPGSSTNYAQLFEPCMKYETPAEVVSELKGQRVIELGPGEHPNAELLFDVYGIAEYVAVEPFLTQLTEKSLNTRDPRNKIVKQDGLSYLLEQQDNSAVMISCAVICPELMIDAEGHKQDYYRFVGKEMYRVTPQGAPNIHFVTGIDKWDVDLFFTSHGFRPAKPIDNKLNLICFLTKP